MQDAENLAWAWLVLAGAGDALLDNYAIEREYATTNIRHSHPRHRLHRPRARISRLYGTVLDLPDHPFARSLINSGRLSPPPRWRSRLNTPDADGFPARTPRRPGDVPVRAGEDACCCASLGSGAIVLADADVTRRVQTCTTRLAT